VDRETFHGFYQETASALRAYLRISCRNWSLADDLMQETYLRMLRQQLPKLDAMQRRAYLYKTAHSVLADHYRAVRRETRWRDEHLSQGATEGAEHGTVLPFEEPLVLDPLELPLDMQRVFDALKAKHKILLWLAYVEGFKHHEIAEVIGVSAASVRVLLSRARAELSAKLSTEGQEHYAGREGAK
jgi:RNA polymerase sigma-70 factor, ECF subfamily